MTVAAATKVAGSAGRYTVELAGEQARNGEGRSEPQRDSHEGESRALLQDEPQNISGQRAQGEADAEFARARRHEKGQHTIDADNAKNKSERGKGNKKNSGGGWRGNGIGDNCVHGFDFADRDLGVEGADGAAKHVLDLRFRNAGLNDHGHVRGDATTFERGFCGVWKVDGAIEPIGIAFLQVVGANVRDDADYGAPLRVAA